MIGQVGAWVDLSGRRLIWSGGVWQSGGVHYFADEFFEDIFECDHSLGMAVVVDEAGQVRAAATQGCECGLQRGGGPDLAEGADPAVVQWQVSAGLVGVQDIGDVDIADQVRSGQRSVISSNREAGESGGGDELLDSFCDAAGVDASDAGHGGASSDDGKLFVTGFECLGACDMAPMASIDERYYGPLDDADAATLIDQLHSGGDVLPDKALKLRPAAGGPEPEPDPRVAEAG